MKRTIPLLLCLTALAPVRRHEGETLRFHGDTNTYIIVWVPPKRFPVWSVTNGEMKAVWSTNGPKFIGISKTNALDELIIIPIEAVPPPLISPSIIPPAAPSTNIVRAVPRTNGPPIYRPTPFAPTQSGKLYHLLHSTDFTNWTVVKSDLVGPNSTNGDVFATNRLPREFWKVLPQDGWSTNVGKARQQPRIGGLRWDLDPSVITK